MRKAGSYEWTGRFSWCSATTRLCHLAFCSTFTFLQRMRQCCRWRAQFAYLKVSMMTEHMNVRCCCCWCATYNASHALGAPRPTNALRNGTCDCCVETSIHRYVGYVAARGCQLTLLTLLRTTPLMLTYHISTPSTHLKRAMSPVEKNISPHTSLGAMERNHSSSSKKRSVHRASCARRPQKSFGLEETKTF